MCSHSTGLIDDPPTHVNPKIENGFILNLRRCRSIGCGTVLRAGPRKHLSNPQWLPGRYFPHASQSVDLIVSAKLCGFGPLALVHQPDSWPHMPTIVTLGHQTRFSPHKRARSRVPCGGWRLCRTVYLFNINHTVFNAVILWAGFYRGIYFCITYTFRRDSPYHAPLSLSKHDSQEPCSLLPSPRVPRKQKMGQQETHAQSTHADQI
jgi:hypothetical protein